MLCAPERAATPWFAPKPLLSHCWTIPEVAVWVRAEDRHMKAKITKRSVESMKPAERDVFFWDTELTGFGCKATPKGSRVYLLQYWRHDRSRRYTIGRHGQGITTE